MHWTYEEDKALWETLLMYPEGTQDRWIYKSLCTKAEETGQWCSKYRPDPPYLPDLLYGDDVKRARREACEAEKWRRYRRAVRRAMREIAAEDAAAEAAQAREREGVDVSAGEAVQSAAQERRCDSEVVPGAAAQDAMQGDSERGLATLGNVKQEPVEVKQAPVDAQQEPLIAQQRVVRVKRERED